MIEVEREDFFVESIKNPLEYGTYYKINQKYGIGFQWTSEVHQDRKSTRLNSSHP